MPSRQSKIMRQKRKRERKKKYLKSLKRRAEIEALHAEEIAGREKMSEVLGEFVAPYAQYADTEQAYRKLLTIAVLAWNACLIPEEEGQAMIEKVFREGIPANDHEAKENLKAILIALMARKRVYFSDNKRFIVSFEVEDTGTSYHVAVLSTLEPPPAK